jgi:hypothetical protein
MKKFDFSEGTVLKKLSAEDDLIGEVNTLFKESKPLEFARP